MFCIIGAENIQSVIGKNAYSLQPTVNCHLYDFRRTDSLVKNKVANAPITVEESCKDYY